LGLSRNKVAVSEGAAGSPPFYGEREAVDRKVYGKGTQGKPRKGKRGRVKREGFE